MCVKGTPLVQEGRNLFWLKDKSGSLLVRLEKPFPFAVDQRLDVVGFPSIASSQLALEYASLSSSAAGNSAQMMAPSRISPGVPRTDGLPSLRHVEQVRSLKSEQAVLAYPVTLQSTVTCIDKAWHLLFIQDDSGGIFVETGDRVPDLMPGRPVEIHGVSGEGAFAPIITLTRFRVLGEGRQPRPRAASFE